MIYTTELLIASVKRRSLAPVSQKTFQDADIVVLLNEELYGSLVPDLLSVREDFFLRSKVIPLVASVNHYGVPERAIGNSLKDLFFNRPGSSAKLVLARVPVREGAVLSVQTGEPSGYFLRADEIVLTETPKTSTGSIEPWYFSRPNELVPTSSCGKITAISSVSGTTTFTIDTDISGALTVGTLFDVLSYKSPFKLWAEDAVVTAVTSSSVSVLTSSVSDESGTVTPVVGDYVCPAQKSNVPQIPSEFHTILAQMVAARLMEALGDLQKLQAINVKLGEMRKQAFSMVANRVESSPPAVLNRTGISSHLGGSRY